MRWIAMLVALGLVDTSACLAETGQAAVFDAVLKGNYSSLPAAAQAAILAGAESGRSAALITAPQSVIDFTIAQSDKLNQATREAYVAALPPRDRARGASMLLGDGTEPTGAGHLYYFVSRSMPMSLLKAYALDAVYTRATLIVKGTRKGDTIKEYLQSVVDDFNSADGQILAGIEINPNLFDVFNVTVVPTAVWTNHRGMDDVGSGCPHEQPPVQIVLDGPDESRVTVDKPACDLAPATSYYKIAGALTSIYVFDKFVEAGAPVAAINAYRLALTERHSDVNAALGTSLGNNMAPITQDIHLDSLPRYVLEAWQDRLAHGPVKRGPYGPSFTPGEEDDPVYRQELQKIVDHGLGLHPVPDSGT